MTREENSLLIEKTEALAKELGFKTEWQDGDLWLTREGWSEEVAVVFSVSLYDDGLTLSHTPDVGDVGYCCDLEDVEHELKRL